jgi:hypothetical protein
MSAGRSAGIPRQSDESPAKPQVDLCSASELQAIDATSRRSAPIVRGVRASEFDSWKGC